MGELDVAAKVILQVAPVDLAGLALPGARVLGVRPVDTTLPALALTMDKLFRVELEGAAEPHMLHVEVAANWAASVPRQAFGYWSLAHRAYDDLSSVVICLKPGQKQGAPRGLYEHVVRGRRTVRFEFDVIRVWELRVDEVLDAGKLGLLPFVPFMAGVTTKHVEHAMATLASVEPGQRRGDLQGALAVFANNIFPDVDWAARIPEELLMALSFYERIYERVHQQIQERCEAAGHAAGEVTGQRKLLTVLLQERLGDRALPLLARLQVASVDVLTQAAKLLAGRHTDDALVQALSEVLPPPQP
jgi:hypothetical protein